MNSATQAPCRRTVGAASNSHSWQEWGNLSDTPIENETAP